MAGAGSGRSLPRSNDRMGFSRVASPCYHHIGSDTAVMLTVELEPELIVALRTMAQQAGVDPDRYIERALQEHVRSHQGPAHGGAADEVSLLREIREELPE